MVDRAPLSGSEGPVLDPVAAIRVRINVEPAQRVTVDMVYGVADSREAALALVDKYQDRRLADRVVELSWTHAQVVLRQIDASENDSRLYARLANSILFANPSLRADPGAIARNRRSQSGLWGYDLPIAPLRIADVEHRTRGQLVQAHAFWRLKGSAVDLVIWNEDRAGYRQVLQEEIMDWSPRGRGLFVNRPAGFRASRRPDFEEDRVPSSPRRARSSPQERSPSRSPVAHCRRCARRNWCPRASTGPKASPTIGRRNNCSSATGSAAFRPTGPSTWFRRMWAA
jgi:cellobiose phosphorylase